MWRMRLLGGSTYRLALEIRSEARRLFQNIEALEGSPFLADVARATMRKLDDAALSVAHTQVEHAVICPEPGAVWDGSDCAEPRDAGSLAWAAWLAVGIALAAAAAYYGGRRRKAWMRMQEDEEVTA